ncbi:ABC transporter permease [Glutamicibacter soli]|uniref:ABC transporter permease n=1 Tax=Glutamicibacter soli TaxID=453836 RepID=A0A365YLA3_9MICC|nr:MULTISPECIES: ABC transporter permease [Micrococcaceae]ALQ31501.1 peptide ABC transporter permease [Arthrobacter sp. YC-RL1]RBM02784.1 ABC transporter permease [Glutamicibacter soli]RKS20858.1 oligopeptide transport system permease protein [Arthrobacter sp. AG1021]
MSTTTTVNPLDGAKAVDRAPDKVRGAHRRWWLKPRFVISGAIVLLMIVMAAFPQLFTGFGPGPTENCDILKSNQPPSAEHLFGIDIQGCDYYTNVIYGARASILVGIVVSAIAFGIAALVGALAGYFGGWVDAVISRICDMAFGLPFILAAIVVLQLFGERNVWTVIFALALFSWPGGVRFMRSSVLEVRNREYVQAARLLGAGNGRILRKHIVPNAITPLLVLQTLGVGGMISAEAGLTFIGIGLTPPAVSWGLQLAAAREYIDAAPHLLMFPAIFLTITVLGFVLFGEAMRDEFDPKGK